MDTGRVWDGLVAKHGEVKGFLGGASDNYWASGRATWNNVILSHLLPLGSPTMLEWGAGSGRITKAALETLPEGSTYYAYEPSAAGRELWEKNLAGADAVMLDETALQSLPANLTHIFCFFVMHHMDYDALWDFFGYVNEHLAPGGILLFDYIPITTTIGARFLARKDRSEWPSYIWHPAQIRWMLNLRAPRLTRREMLCDRARWLEVWQRSE